MHPLAKYVWKRVREQLISVGMVAGYLTVFILAVLREPPEGSVWAGLGTAVVGIALFLEGFVCGIMPLGEMLGMGLEKFSLYGAMLTTFFLGIACTLAEPAMGALEIAGAAVQVEKAPVLWTLLNPWNQYLSLSIGVGVGFASLIGTLRLLKGWSLKTITYLSSTSSVLLTVVVEITGLSETVGLAWDSGAVTTGAVTVPIILGLGVGILKARQNRAAPGEEVEESPLDSFGIVTLASLYPVNAVYLLALVCKAVMTEDEMIANAANSVVDGNATAVEEALIDQTPYNELYYATRSVAPLIAILVGLIKYALKEELPSIELDLYDGLEGPDDEGMNLHCMFGVVEAYVGMFLFNIGLKYGLGPLGEMVGAAVPGLWDEAPAVPDSPLLPNKTAAVVVIAIFTFMMALVATYAEPALNAMGQMIEVLSEGQFTKSMLMLAVAIGVACGVTIGMLRLILGWNLTVLLCIGYGIAIPLTKPSCLEYVAVSWDAAGVTTGSITVPLVLAMGLGLGKKLGLTDAFGLLAMGSIGPIVSVLVTGLYVQSKKKKVEEVKEEEKAPDFEAERKRRQSKIAKAVMRCATLPPAALAFEAADEEDGKEAGPVILMPRASKIHAEGVRRGSAPSIDAVKPVKDDEVDMKQEATVVKAAARNQTSPFKSSKDPAARYSPAP